MIKIGDNKLLYDLIRCLIIALLGLGFVQCSSTKIVVRGVACDAKAGAIIITDNKSVYYVGELYEWPEKYCNKRVKVNGQLETIIHQADTTGPLSHIPSQHVPIMDIIKNPKYRKTLRSMIFWWKNHQVKWD